MKAIIKRQHPIWGEFPTLFDDIFNDWNTGSVMRNVPAVNVIETDDAFKLELAAPGCRKEDFSIEVNQNTLTIGCESRDEKLENEGKYTRKEFSYQQFKRSFTLPQNTVNLDSIEARYEDGVLNITIPKLDSNKTKLSRTINIA